MGLAKPNLKEQQVNINLLNIFLMGTTSMTISKHLSPLLEDKSLVSNLLTMLEQSTEVLRGKSIVCAALLCKVNRRWLTSLCSGKLLAVSERLLKEKECYVKQCLDALVQTIVDIVPNILDSIGSDVQQPAVSGKRLTPQSGKSQVKNSLSLFPIILHLFESPVFREKIVNDRILKLLAGFLSISQTASFPVSIFFDHDINV
jgi:serine/threonine-protein kinase ULK4